jgi:diacylglycerol kinase
MVKFVYPSKGSATTRFSWKRRGASVTYAFHGILVLFRTEHNAWIHAVLTGLALLLACLLRISALEWIVLCLSITAVFTTEIINTAIEKAMDFISIERHPQIKLVKDLAAAAVLLSAVAAFIIGTIIFLPKLLNDVETIAKQFLA